MADGADLRLACIEHLVKSSLAVIAGWATTLDEKWDGLTEAQRRHAISVIRRRADQITVQTERLLAAETAVPVLLEVRPLLEDVSGGTQAVTVEGDVTAKADPDGLSHVVTLLVENALKYSPPDSAIELGARTKGDRVEVWVTDQGDGLPEGCDVFAPGARGDSEVTGVGLGLYIAATIVRSMGGSIAAQDNVGAGSTFVVTLPAA